MTNVKLHTNNTYLKLVVWPPSCCSDCTTFPGGTARTCSRHSSGVFERCSDSADCAEQRYERTLGVDGSTQAFDMYPEKIISFGLIFLYMIL